MECLPLLGNEPAGLSELFEEEIDYWQEQLHWDYRPSIGLIRRYVRTRQLPAYVLSHSGKAVGYTYYVANHPVGFIGDIFVQNLYADPANYSILLQKAFESLKTIPLIRRIECQIVPFNADLQPLFTACGFQARERHFLVLELDEAPSSSDGLSVLGFRPMRWNRSYFDATASIIYDSYRDSPDKDLCFDYQSLKGCARFLSNIIDNPGCGSFRPEDSFLALDASKRLCGVLLTSVISNGTGMIPQISVRRDCQGHGIGSGLLHFYFARARREGFKRIALSVSSANRDAYRLYRRLGFQERKTFHAFIWNEYFGAS